MKTSILIMLAFLLLFPLIQSQVFACECFGSSDYTEIFDRSNLVFVGTMNEMIANGENSKVSVTFDVHSIAKGELSHSQVTTSTWLSDCSVDYEIGMTYVVAINDKEIFSTDRCSTKPLEIMSHYEVIPYQLLSTMTEPEVPDINLVKSTEGQQPPLENDENRYVSIGLSNLLNAVREDIPIGNYRFNDVVHGGGLAHGNLYINVNPEITDSEEQEEIFQELVVILGYDSFEISFAEPTTTTTMQQQDKALCESPEIIVVDGVCQKITDSEHLLALDAYEKLNNRTRTDLEFEQLMQTEVVGFGVDDPNKGIFIAVDPKFATKENFAKYENIFRETVGYDIPVRFEINERGSFPEGKDPDYILLVLVPVLALIGVTFYLWRKRR